MDSMKKGSKEMQEKILLLQKERDQVIQCTRCSFHLNWQILCWSLGVCFVVFHFSFLETSRQTNRQNELSKVNWIRIAFYFLKRLIT